MLRRKCIKIRYFHLLKRLTFPFQTLSAPKTFTSISDKISSIISSSSVSNIPFYTNHNIQWITKKQIFFLIRKMKFLLLNSITQNVLFAETNLPTSAFTCNVFGDLPLACLVLRSGFFRYARNAAQYRSCRTYCSSKVSLLIINYTS